VLTDEKYFNLVYKWFDYMKNHYGNKNHGYVIMPNHMDSLVYISEYSPDVSKLIQNAKSFQTYEIVDYLEEDNRKDTSQVKNFDNHKTDLRLIKEKIKSKFHELKNLFV